MDNSVIVRSVSDADHQKLKRQCRSFPDPIRISKPNSSPMDALLESFLDLYDSSEIALDISIDRIIDSKHCDSDKIYVIDRALWLGTAVTEAAKRAARKHAAMHNGVVWVLPSDLTIKVFSLLDTRSVCHAAATCSFFHKCAADPLCYSNIDLTTPLPMVNNMVVSTMIQRAGKVLRSLKLGVLPFLHVASPSSSQKLPYSNRSSLATSGLSWHGRNSKNGKESVILTRSCLAPLIADGGAPGARLRKLHLYNIERIDNTTLGAAISACPSLLDLEIVALHVGLSQTLKSVIISCPILERLFFESSRTGRCDNLKLRTCNDLTTNCPQLSSLALRGFQLNDASVRLFVKGFRKLKYLDLSTSYSITGAFITDLGEDGHGNLLEVLLLRDCRHLREEEVSGLLSEMLTGRFSRLRHLDISNREGLASGGSRRCYTPSFLSLGELLKERPKICFVADFPEIESSMVDPMTDSDTDSTSSTSSQTSDGFGNGFTSSSSSSYSSDQSSGNEHNPNYGHPVHEGSPVDDDFFFIRS